jgi:hypothetical protein
MSFSRNWPGTRLMAGKPRLGSKVPGVGYALTHGSAVS